MPAASPSSAPPALPVLTGGRYAILPIVALAGLLRLVALDAVPPGINHDEAERAVDAWCILHTGRDFHGQAWPIFFRAYGQADYPPGHYIYALVPFQALFGMSPATTRLPAAILGTLNVWWLYAFVRRLASRRVALHTALLLAISPWHLLLSRMAFEVSLCIPLCTLGLLLLSIAGQRLGGGADRPARARSTLLIAATAGLVLGITAWGYNAYRVVVPLVLLATAVVHRHRLGAILRTSAGRRAASAFGIGLLVGLAPFLYACIATPDQAWARASTEILTSRTPTLWAALTEAVRTYFLHLSPGWLFWQGDTNIVQALPGYGQMHLIAAILVPAGIARAILRRRTERLGLLALAWVLIGPLPAGATRLDVGHALRAAGMMPGLQILAALGLDLVLELAARRRRRAAIAAVTTAALAIAASAADLGRRYFYDYPRQAARAFHADWATAIPDILAHADSYDRVLLTTQYSGQVGMLLFFYGRIDPATLAAQVRIEPGRQWDKICGYGRIEFASLPQYLWSRGPLPPGSYLVLERPQIPVPGEVIRMYHHSDGRSALIAWALRIDAPLTSLPAP